MPKFMLKNFSNDTEAKSINIFVITNAKTIQNAGLSDQCKKDYFYGHNLAMEKELSHLEGNCSVIFKTAIDSKTLPLKKSANHSKLLEFLSVQLSRTEKEDSANNEWVDKMAKYILTSKCPELRGLDDILIRVKNSVLFEICRGVLMAPVMADLEYKLLVATGDEEFILSDNPAVIFNQYFGYKNLFFTHGKASQGLQILLPISPRHALIFYDKAIYKIGEKRKSTVHINTLDTRQFNILQYLNAGKTVYFRTAKNINYMNQIHTEFNTKRVLDLSYCKPETVCLTENGKEQKGLTFGANRPQFAPVTQCISIIRRRKRNNLPMGLRDPAWAKIVNDKCDIVEKELISKFWDLSILTK